MNRNLTESMLAAFYDRRGNLHGQRVWLSIKAIMLISSTKFTPKLKAIVGVFAPHYAVHRMPSEGSIVQFPSGDRMYRLEEENAFGTLEDFLKIVTRELNFTVSRYIREDQKWGSYDNATGGWNGQVRSLRVGDVDLSWSPLTLTMERATAADWLLPYLYEHECVVRDKKTSSFYLYQRCCGLRPSSGATTRSSPGRSSSSRSRCPSG